MPYLELSGVFSLLIAGLSLWCAARVLKTTPDSLDASGDVLRFTALVLISMGLLGICFITTGPFGFITWLIVLGIWGRIALHYRDAQKRNLLSALALAVEKQMPLAPMALAFADEQEGAFARRARAFANQLVAGSSLAEAIARSRGLLPREAKLAAQVGLQSGDFSGALQATSYNSLFDRTLLRPIMTRLFYFFPVMFAFLLFMQIKIEPSYVKIFEDFGLPLPTLNNTASYFMSSGTPSFANTTTLRWEVFLGGSPLFSYSLGGFSTLTNACLIVSVAGAAVALLAYLEWRGTLRPRLPGWKRIVNWVDMGIVLRILALAARHERPLSNMVSAIARYHPKRSVRSRMRRVLGDINDGQSWIVALQRQRLLRRTDSAILASAQRSGNLSWALVEMAESFERRAGYRLQAISQIMLPLMVLPIGLVTAMIVIRYFVPLTFLIHNLS